MSLGVSSTYEFGRNITEPITTLKPKKKNVTIGTGPQLCFRAVVWSSMLPRWTPPTIHHPALVFGPAVCRPSLPGSVEAWSLQGRQPRGYLQSRRLEGHQLPAPPPWLLHSGPGSRVKAFWLSRKIRSVKDSKNRKVSSTLMHLPCMIRAWTETENLPDPVWETRYVTRVLHTFFFFNQ